MNVNIRNIKISDYDEVCELGTNSYPENYYEGKESFISKIKGCHEGCFVADLDGIVGYIISFPYIVGKSFPINNFYEPIEESNCWYIHDICVSKDFRGTGIAKTLAFQIIKNNGNVICLTSVMNSENFWSKLGFRGFFDLDYCGMKAKYMILIK